MSKLLNSIKLIGRVNLTLILVSINQDLRAEYITTSDSPWQSCALTLINKTENKERSPMYLASKVKSRTNTKYMQYLFSLMYVESRFSPSATSHVGAYGMGQMTDVAMVEASRYCNLPPKKALEVHDSRDQVRYSSCYFSFLLEKFEGEQDQYRRALIVYNGGFRQLTKYQMGEMMHQETANYVLKVEKAVQECRLGSKD